MPDLRLVRVNAILSFVLALAALLQLGRDLNPSFGGIFPILSHFGGLGALAALALGLAISLLLSNRRGPRQLVLAASFLITAGGLAAILDLSSSPQIWVIFVTLDVALTVLAYGVAILAVLVVAFALAAGILFLILLRKAKAAQGALSPQVPGPIPAASPSPVQPAAVALTESAAVAPDDAPAANAVTPTGSQPLSREPQALSQHKARNTLLALGFLGVGLSVALGLPSTAFYLLIKGQPDLYYYVLIPMTLYFTFAVSLALYLPISPFVMIGLCLIYRKDKRLGLLAPILMGLGGFLAGLFPLMQFVLPIFLRERMLVLSVNPIGGGIVRLAMIGLPVGLVLFFVSGILFLLRSRRYKRPRLGLAKERSLP